MLSVSDLCVRFGAREPVVEGVCFDLAAGERLGLIGESGSGKSVTALAIMGLLAETARISGSVRLHGEELIGSSDARMRHRRGDQLSMIFQEPMTALDPTMIVGRQVAEARLLHSDQPRREVRARVQEILAQVGLADPDRVARSFPHQLSGGQRQRVIIAMAIINAPDLVICDEPTTALDVTVQAKVLALLDQTLTASGAGCLFISHDLAVVSQVCSRVLVMLEGRVVERGPIERVLRDPQHPYTRGLVMTARIDAVPAGERLPVISDFYDAGRA